MSFVPLSFHSHPSQKSLLNQSDLQVSQAQKQYNYKERSDPILNSLILSSPTAYFSVLSCMCQSAFHLYSPNSIHLNLHHSLIPTTRIISANDTITSFKEKNCNYQPKHLFLHIPAQLFYSSIREKYFFLPQFQSFLPVLLIPSLLGDSRNVLLTYFSLYFQLLPIRPIPGT